jgi:hypothetical protein
MHTGRDGGGGGGVLVAGGEGNFVYLSLRD